MAKNKTNPSKTNQPPVKPLATVAKKNVVSAIPRTSTFEAGFWRTHWLPALVLAAFAFAIYGISVGYGYLLDDQMVIWENKYVLEGFGGLRNIFAHDSFMGYFKEEKFLLEGGRYRPLSLATFAIETGLFGKDHPGISHFINIVLYALNSILLYRILLGLFPVREGGQWFFSAAFIGALLFTVHPIHTECVANIKGRDEILALLGSLAALYAMLRYFDTQKAKWLIFSGIALFLGLLSKENALTFLAVIPLTVWFFAKVPAKRVAAASWPLVVAALLFILVRYKAMGYMVNHGKSVTDLMNNPFLGMNTGERFATIFLTLGWYVKLLFVPYPLTLDYYPYHVPKVDWTNWRPLLSLACYLGLGVWSLLQLRKRSVPAYAFLFWIITLSIVSNLFVSIGTFMNERFIYMPSVAFCLWIGWLFARKIPDLIGEQHDRLHILGGGVLAVVLVLFSIVSFNRTQDWRDESALNTSSVRVSPNSARSHCFHVTAIYKNEFKNAKTKEEKAPWVDTMEYHIKRSLEIYPDYGAALIMKAAVAAARFEQDNQMDRLFHEFEIVIEKIPYNTNVRTFLDQYLDYLQGSNPDKYLAFCYRVGYELFYKKLKDPRTGLHFMEYALKRQWDDKRTYESAAEIYQVLGDGQRADAMRAKAAAM
jgi:protein O-mannosyl-transferase